MSETKSRGRDFAWIICAYFCACLAAYGAYRYATSVGEGSLMAVFYADLMATLVIFSFSCAFANSSFYDAYWSVAPPLIFLAWMVTAVEVDIRALVLFVLVVLWAVRLTHNWARGWHGLSHVDWRYVDLRAKTGRAYPLVDLFGIHLFPTLLVFAGCLPLWWVTQKPVPLSWLDGLWIVVGFGALYLEWRADNVLRRFRLERVEPAAVLRIDVWGWCRHPNYVGEMGFWLGLAIAGHAVHAGVEVWIGFAAMVLLFVFISIPMIDKRQLATKPDYAQYKAQVPALIPRLNRSTPS